MGDYTYGGMNPHGMAGQGGDCAAAAQLHPLPGGARGAGPFAEASAQDMLSQQLRGGGGGAMQGSGTGLSHMASMLAAMQAQVRAGGPQQPNMMAQLMAQAGMGSLMHHGQSNGLHDEDEMEEDDEPGISNGARVYDDEGYRMESDDERQEGGGEGGQHAYDAGGFEQASWTPMLGSYHGASSMKRLDKADVKKAKRGVYVALREVWLPRNLPNLAIAGLPCRPHLVAFAIQTLRFLSLTDVWVLRRWRSGCRSGHFRAV